MVFLLVLLVRGAGAVTLNVDDSLNRYSLFGKKGVQIDFRASTSAGGWVGSNNLVSLNGLDTIRSVVTSAGNLVLNNTTNVIWDKTRVSGDISGGSLHDQEFDSSVYIGGTFNTDNKDNWFKDSLFIAGGHFRQPGWGQSFFGPGRNPTGSANIPDYTPATTPPLSNRLVWGARPGTSVFSGITWPDTNFNVNMARNIGTLNSAGFRWTCGSNVGSNLVPAVCNPNDTVLPPGEYGDLVLQFGTTLYLGEGVYSFNSITLNNATATFPTRLLATQPHGSRTVVLIKSGFTNKSSGIKNVIAPEKYRMGYGIDSSHFAGGTMMLYSQSDMTLDVNFQLWATVVAPHSTVTLSDRVSLFGQILADSIRVLNDFKGTDGAFIPIFLNDPVIKVSKFNAAVLEKDLLANGKPDTSIAEFVLQMDHINGIPVRVWYHTEADTGFSAATTGVDYVSVARAYVDVAPTRLLDTIRIPVLGDRIWEGNETFHVVLDSTVNGKLGPTSLDSVGVGTIVDNETPPEIFFVRTSDSVAEGTSKSLKIRMSFVIGKPLTVAYAVVPGAVPAATEGLDFSLVPSPKVVTIPVGVDTSSILVAAISDGLWESTERLRIQLSSPSIPQVTIHPTQGLDTVAILNIDPIPSLQVNDTTVDEGQTAFPRVGFRNAPASGDSACFDWTTSTPPAADSATTWLDYVPASGHACIPSGASSIVLPAIATKKDTIFENPERVLVRLTPTYGALGLDTGVVSIRNTNSKPTVRIDDVSAVRPGSGTVVYHFKVHLVDPVSGKPTVSGATAAFSWTTLRGTALPGLDYDSTGSGYAVFNALTDSVLDLAVTVRGSSQYHAIPLQFKVALTAISGIDTSVAAPQRKLSGTGTIRAAVGAPRVVWIGDTVPEGVGGTRTAVVFTASLQDSLGNPTTSRDPVVLVWSTQDSTAFAGPNDTQYVARVQVLDTIRPGRSFVTDSVLVVGNDLFQDSMRVFKAVLDPSDSRSKGYDKAKSATRALGGIVDADIAPLVAAVSGTKLSEGDIGTRDFPFVVALDRPSGKPFVYSWRTNGVGTATSGVDYLAQPAVQRTVPPGRTSDTIQVKVVGDTHLESDETFQVEVLPVSGSRSTAAIAGTDTILNDDAAPRLRISVDSSVLERDAGTHPVTFGVVLKDPGTGSTVGQANASNLPVAFRWRTIDGSAKAADNDYVPQAARWDTIRAGDTGKTISVQVRGDTRYENNETFQVSIDSATAINATGNVFLDSATIQNDDTLPRVSIRDTSVKEPSIYGATADMVFQARLSLPSGLPVQVGWKTVSHTASGTDSFSLRRGDYRDSDSGASIVFAPGETVKWIRVPVYGDTIYEKTEDFLVQLGPIGGAKFARDLATGTILDADTAPAIRVVDANPVDEGSKANFTIRLDRPSEVPVYLTATTRSGSATNGIDYQAFDSALALRPGAVSLAFQVPAFLDTIANEGTEDFRLSIRSIVDAYPADTSGTGWIRDLNPRPTLSIDSVAPVVESDTVIRFRVAISGASAVPVPVDFATLSGTATANADFKDSSGTLQVPAMARFAWLPARILGDQLDEDSLETFYMKLVSTDSRWASIQDSIGLAGILDNDPLPKVSVADSFATEPVANLAKGPITFRVFLDKPSGRTVAVNWKTVDGAARAVDNDYVAASGTLTFPAGTTSQTITVQMQGDTLDEFDETFKVVLSAPFHALVQRDTGVGTILDSDLPPGIAVSDLVVREGSRKDVTAYFNISLERPSGKPVSFHYATRDSTALSTGTTPAGTLDYVAISGDTTLPAGTRSIRIPVTIKYDNFSEADEQFRLVLSNLANLNRSTSDSVGLATILDGNGLPGVSIDSAAPVLESGDSAVFLVRLEFPSSQSVKVKFHTLPGTASRGNDFGDTVGTITFAPSDTVARIKLKILDDRFHEPDTEDFFLHLDSSSLANIQDSTGRGRILDDDPPPSISIDDASLLEPASIGAVDSLRLHVSLSTPSNLPVAVDFSSQDSTATGSLDYLPVAGTLVFQPGDSVLVVSVPVLGDSLDEYDESLVVRLASPVGGRLGDSLGIATILDNDTAPAVRIDDSRVTEPAKGSVASVFRIHLQRPSAKPISLSWATRGGTATSGLDFAPGSGSLSLRPGITDTGVSVSVLSDSIAGEGDETYSVTLSSLSNTLPGDTLGVGTIVDIQGNPGVSIDSVGQVVEADTMVHFRIRLDWYPAKPVQVWWHTQAGSATPGIRYVDTSGTLVLPAGKRLDSVGVRLLNDHISERIPETFYAIIDSAKTASIKSAVGLATLLDDGDEPPVVVGNADTVMETGIARFPVRITGQTKDTVYVWYHTVDSTATTASGDYLVAKGMLTFYPGQTMLQIPVQTLTDTLWEPVESFEVVVDSVFRGLLSPTLRQGIGWIKDDGNAPKLSFATLDTTVVEDLAGSVPLTVSLDRAASIPLKVAIQVRPTSTATRGLDYSLSDLRSDTLTIPAGARSVVFHVPVVPDSIDEYDETVDLSLQPVSPALPGGRPNLRLTILDDDSAPSLAFSVDSQTVREDVGSVRVTAKLSKPSAKPIATFYHVGGTATPGLDHSLAAGSAVGFSFLPGVDTSSIVFRIVDDRITEPTETVAMVMDSARNASLSVGRSEQIVRILDNDSAPVVSFGRPDTTVEENVGTVPLRLVLDHPSAFPVSILVHARGKATLDSLKPGSDAVLDSTVAYWIQFAPMDTVASFAVRVLDDGRVESTEWIDLSLSPFDTTGRAGTGMRFTILDNDHDPDVKISRPLDSSHTADPFQPVEWTVDGIPQAPSSDTLRQGWNTLHRCFTDTAGNTGCDTVHVWADFTPPKVQVFKITGPNTHNPNLDTTWWGKRARTRFGRDTVWYWVRDSIETSNGAWIVRVDTHSVVTDFHGDSLFPVPVSVCDSVRNCGRDTGWIDLKQSIPRVTILTPPEGARVITGEIPVFHQVADAGKIWNVSSTTVIRTPGLTKLSRCYMDDVGNEGCDAHSIDVQPVHVIRSVYVDLNGDGRVDAAIVDLDSKWVGESLPSFDFNLNDSIRLSQRPDSTRPFYAGQSRGRPMLVGPDTVWVSAGSFMRDSAGHILIGPDGLPLTNVMGDTVHGVDGNPLRDSLGRVLYKVAGPGQADSTRLLVPIVPPFPFGMTGFDSLQNAYMNAVWSVYDSLGHKVQGRFVDTFRVDEKVPPVVLLAEVHRVENYEDPDTLYITPSEPLELGAGKDWLEVWGCPGNRAQCDSASMVWVRVPADSVHATGDGRYWFLVPPGDSGSIRPNFRVRFRSNVSDNKGNGVDTANTHWSTLVTGVARPELVRVTPPGRLPKIPNSETGVIRPGAILLKATRGRMKASQDRAWWEPGRGYINPSEVRDACPNPEWCNGPTVYINRPARMIIYIYDRVGTYVTSRVVTVTQSDIDQMEPDQLDRLSIELDWNHRTAKGELVASGVYLWRIVSYIEVAGHAMPVMTNSLFKVGVQVIQP